jgi:crotonobetainyl-CoA:carnitine CoA-transferase CaiB-like acyl-CoA transferase
MSADAMPLAGLRVLDFGHTVMGPTAGLILADLGAEVIRIEPVAGDPTRRLKGFGTGYFPFFNRNKQSVALNLKDSRGLGIVKRLLTKTDVLIENFAPGTMTRLGLDYGQIGADYPRLIYLSLKGFLPGLYENRIALDEVVQMMSGLAYMTGPPGQPLRAGASVVDIMGGTFGVVAVQAALIERQKTGQGQLVKSALFESAMFLMGQHLAYAAQSDEPVPPMPARVSAWAIYDQFRTKDDHMVFLGITSDKHWLRFCNIFGCDDLSADATLATNNQRIEARARLLPRLAATIAGLDLAAVTEKAIAADLPFAPIARPEALFNDPHLNDGGYLLETIMPNGEKGRLPNLPISLDGRIGNLTRNPPVIGADTGPCLESLGFSAAQIKELYADGIIGLADDAIEAETNA